MWCGVQRFHKSFKATWRNAYFGGVPRYPVGKHRFEISSWRPLRAPRAFFRAFPQVDFNVCLFVFFFTSEKTTILFVASFPASLQKQRIFCDISSVTLIAFWTLFFELHFCSYKNAYVLDIPLCLFTTTAISKPVFGMCFSHRHLLNFNSTHNI